MKKLTKEQERGVDLVIKAITKSFSFIKGGKVSETYELYDGLLFIDLFIDFFELAELNNTEIRPFWVDSYEKYGKDVLRSTTLFSYSDSEDFSKYYSIRDDIKNKLNTFYDFLPDNMCAESNLVGLFDEKTTTIKPNISVGEFQQYK
jgi:hypothetical protein